MDPVLQQQLAEYLKSIATTAQAGAAFVVEQAPLVVQEKIAYGRAVETVALLAWLVGVVVCARSGRAAWAAAEKDDYDNPFYIFGGLAAVIGLVVSVLFVFGQFAAVAKVWFAPRLYILEWAARLVR